MRVFQLLAFILVWCCVSSVLWAAPTVYTGYGVSFTKVGFADPTDPANQDIITPNVKITRGGNSGIFNAATESFYTSASSPAGTSWAFLNNNPGATLSASNWAALNFTDWETALGSAAAGGPPSTVGQNAVLHLVDDDIYLDVRFTAWGQGGASGGSFSYVRAAVPEPTTILLALGGLAVGCTSRRRLR